jgi:hypothetical protein
MQPRQRFRQRQPWTSIAIAFFALILIAGAAWAAEIASGDTYHLPAGQTIDNDLYVTAGEIIIDGVVNGDLVAMGGYIEINGEVTEDLLAAGGGIVINGVVGDDVRAAGNGVTLAGQVGDDFVAAGGGAMGMGIPAFPIPINGRSIVGGVYVKEGATIGGDAYIAGGTGEMGGKVNGDLSAGMGDLTVSGQVGGDATIYARTLATTPDASVSGKLTYSVQETGAVDENVAGAVEEIPAQAPTAEAQPTTMDRLMDWGLRTLRVLLGVALLGWFLLWLTPGLLRTPANIIRERGLESAIFGFVFMFLFVPLVVALVFLTWLFWGWGAAILAFIFLFSFAGLVWLFSILATGLWLGRWLARVANWNLSDLWSVIIGVLIIAAVIRLLALIPCVGVLAGGLIYAISFALVTGAWIRHGVVSRRATL